MLQTLGVGTQDPVDWNELKYVYEKDLVALPTLAVTLAAGAMRLAPGSGDWCFYRRRWRSFRRQCRTLHVGRHDVRGRGLQIRGVLLVHIGRRIQIHGRRAVHRGAARIER